MADLFDGLTVFEGLIGLLVVGWGRPGGFAKGFCGLPREGETCRFCLRFAILDLNSSTFAKFRG